MFTNLIYAYLLGVCAEERRRLERTRCTKPWVHTNNPNLHTLINTNALLEWIWRIGVRVRETCVVIVPGHDILIWAMLWDMCVRVCVVCVLCCLPHNPQLIGFNAEIICICILSMPGVSWFAVLIWPFVNCDSNMPPYFGNILYVCRCFSHDSTHIIIIPQLTLAPLAVPKRVAMATPSCADAQKNEN